MSTTEFSIVRAVRGAYGFVWQEWKYLLRISLLPLGISAATQFFLYTQGKDMSAFEAFSWSVPSTALMAWFMFQESRLLLLGERAEALPENPEYLAARRAALNSSICIWLLFNMGWSILIGYHEWALGGLQPQEQAQQAQEFWPIGLGALLFGMFFWSLRFGVAHILAAVDYPLRRYVRQVSGLGISLRLAGLSLLTCMPVLFLFAMLADLVAPDITRTDDPILSVVVLMGAPLSVIVAALMNAAGAFALREMLGDNQGRLA